MREYRKAKGKQEESRKKIGKGKKGGGRRGFGWNRGEKPTEKEHNMKTFSKRKKSSLWGGIGRRMEKASKGEGRMMGSGIDKGREGI